MLCRRERRNILETRIVLWSLATDENKRLNIFKIGQKSCHIIFLVNEKRLYIEDIRLYLLRFYNSTKIMLLVWQNAENCTKLVLYELF